MDQSTLIDAQVHFLVSHVTAQSIPSSNNCLGGTCRLGAHPFGAIPVLCQVRVELDL